MIGRLSVLLLLFLFLLTGCKSGFLCEWQSETLQKSGSGNEKYIFFIQSNNSINSRIAQDQLVRISSHVSIQSYLYLKEERLNKSNENKVQQKLIQDGFKYAVIVHLIPFKTDSVVSDKRSFFDDYMLFIDPYFYNPVYEWPHPDFNIETSVYLLSDYRLIWNSISKNYPTTAAETALEENSELFVKRLKKAGIMN